MTDDEREQQLEQQQQDAAEAMKNGARWDHAREVLERLGYLVLPPEPADMTEEEARAVVVYLARRGLGLSPWRTYTSVYWFEGKADRVVFEAANNEAARDLFEEHGSNAYARRLLVLGNVSLEAIEEAPIVASDG